MYIESYQPADYGATYFDVADGIHDMKIYSAVEKTSKMGKRMIEITYVVKECPTIPYKENIVEGEYFNRNCTRLFDAFGIQRGNFNFQSWVGKYAKGMFVHKDETYTGNDGVQKTINKCRLSYLIVPEAEPAPQQYQQQQSYPQQQNGTWTY